MELRDVIHGSIPLEPHEVPVLDSRYFQRLRQIKQLGFGELAYPSATHNRYIHSLGALHTATQAFDTIFGGPLARAPSIRTKDSPHLSRFRRVLRLSAMLHDIGHGPLSHTTEFAMPPVSELRLPLEMRKSDLGRKANHEDYTLKILLDSGLTPILEKAGKPYGFGATHVAALIDDRIPIHDSFFLESIDGQASGEKIDFRPLLKQLISSELDADRMDYLRRDSFHAGVNYGNYDFDWLVTHLTFHIERKPGQTPRALLALEHRALYAFEDFLISRFHMFLMVYLHQKSVIFDEMLQHYFESPECDYALPADIERYCDYDDAHLLTHLAKSPSTWAKRITERNPYRVLLELHSGIPTSPDALKAQTELLKKVKGSIKESGIHLIETNSTGEISKYFQTDADPIYVRYDNRFSRPDFIPLPECTDLYQRYREKRVITRLYVASENLLKARGDGRERTLMEQNATI